MCGRYALARGKVDLMEYYNAGGALDWQGSYNICPTHQIPVLVETEQGRELRLMKWGLVPHWAKDEKIGYKMINARAETVADKPGFRDAFKTKRCIIPAEGFYEWTKEKQPWYFTPTDGLFSFCGLWSRWKKPDGSEIDTCTIITTDANETVAKVHDRMPVAITDNMIPLWLSGETPAADLKSFLAPYPASRTKATRVSKHVNSPKNGGAECVREVNSE